MAVFAERSVEEVSVEDILERAQVSRQTFYRCYRGKAEVLEDIHEFVTAQLKGLAEQMTHGDLSLHDSLRHHVKLLFDHAAQSGPIVGTLEREALRPGSPFRRHRERRLRFAQGFLAAWVAQRIGRRPSRDLVRAVALALEQLVRDVAELAGSSPEKRRAAERSALELMEALVLHTQHAR